jgi:DNA-binding LacI/PurR family transcriptional regulator
MLGIKQLAEYLNISIGTVSRALNNKPDVNDETRRRVKAAAEKLGYRPNQSGRSLRQGTTNIIAMLVNTDSFVASTAETFIVDMSDGVQDIVEPLDLDLVLITRSNRVKQTQALQRIVQKRLADGVIITRPENQDPRIPILVNAKIPFVVVGRFEETNGFIWTDLDAEAIAKQSVDRLVSRGHRRIAILVPRGRGHSAELYLRSYMQALESHNIPYLPELVFHMDNALESANETAEKLFALEDPATAVMLGEDVIARPLYSRLIALGIQPGRDIAIIGAREHPQNRMLSPSLTSFRVDPYGIGRKIGLQMLASLPTYAVQYRAYQGNQIVPMELIPGESDNFTL